MTPEISISMPKCDVEATDVAICHAEADGVIAEMFCEQCGAEWSSCWKSSCWKCGIEGRWRPNGEARKCLEAGQETFLVYHFFWGLALLVLQLGFTLAASYIVLPVNWQLSNSNIILMTALAAQSIGMITIAIVGTRCRNSLVGWRRTELAAQILAGGMIAWNFGDAIFAAGKSTWLFLGIPMGSSAEDARESKSWFFGMIAFGLVCYVWSVANKDFGTAWGLAQIFGAAISINFYSRVLRTIQRNRRFAMRVEQSLKSQGDFGALAGGGDSRST